MFQSKPDLKVDWCSHEAAKYACQRWHYSDVFPTSKNNYIGVWENEIFIGVIIFGMGASASLGKPYKLGVFEVCELVRVALASHEIPTTRIIKLSISLLKKKNPGLRLIVSFADPFYGHMGILYQAGNWIYTGEGQSFDAYKLKSGKIVHKRRFSGQGWNAAKRIPDGTEEIKMPPKFRYLMPLDKKMRKQILPLRQPYPKRQRVDEASNQ